MRTKIIKHIITNDRGERYCSHHLRYTSAIGGIDKPVMGGRKTRWICQKCVDSHAKRKQLTREKKIITTCAQTDEMFL